MFDRATAIQEVVEGSGQLSREPMPTEWLIDMLNRDSQMNQLTKAKGSFRRALANAKKDNSEGNMKQLYEAEEMFRRTLDFIQNKDPTQESIFNDTRILLDTIFRGRNLSVFACKLMLIQLVLGPCEL